MANLEQCIAALKQGQVIAYPTEAVFGVGCDPDNVAAIENLLAIKQRDRAKGLILVAANLTQLEDYIDFSALNQHMQKDVKASWPGPVTWIMPAGKKCTHWLSGAFSNVAVRVSEHPLVQELCLGFGKPITSTSANLSGQTPCRTAREAQAKLGAVIDNILLGEIGKQDKPTEIRDAKTGKVWRAG